MPTEYDLPPRWPPALAVDPDWTAAIDMGVDVVLLEANLRLSPADRIRQLTDMLALCDKIKGTAGRR